jgi:phage terminase large subunit GpA-like protein
LFQAVRESWVTPPFLSVTEWAARHRYLGGSESGLYNPQRCFYQQTIQDAFADPEVRQITWMSAERVGKSTVGSNILGYVIDRAPCNVLWVMPSRESVSDYLKDEIEPMLRASPLLLGKVSSGRKSEGKTNNARRKTFPGGSVTFVGAGSASPLAFRTIKVLILDEVDKFKNLPGEGDAASLAEKRTSTYGTDFKILRFSKPSVEGESRIARHYARGTMARYFIGCPSCGEPQELGWAQLRFDDLTMRCTRCDGFFDQDSWLRQRGQWRESVRCVYHKSFTCSALVSPLISWSVLLDEYREAIAALQAGDPSLIQVFENSRLGQLYSGRVNRIQPGELYEQRENFLPCYA